MVSRPPLRWHHWAATTVTRDRVQYYLIVLLSLAATRKSIEVRVEVGIGAGGVDMRNRVRVKDCCCF